MQITVFVVGVVSQLDEGSQLRTLVVRPIGGGGPFEPFGKYRKKSCKDIDLAIDLIRMKASSD